MEHLSYGTGSLLQNREEREMKRENVAVLVSGICAILILISGCATTPSLTFDGPSYYGVVVDSIAAPDADLKNKTYVLTSAMKNVSDYDIQFKEFARYIENALAKTGYQRVEGDDADLIIRLAYGIGQPKTETSTQTVTTASGYSYPVGWTWINVPPQTETVTTKNTTYERFLMVEAFDSSDRRSQLWRTTVRSEGTVSDLRVALPHMIAAAIYNFGTDTKGKTSTAMYVNAPRVLDIVRSSDAGDKDTFSGKERLGVMLELLPHKDQLYTNNYVEKAGVLVTAVAENSVAHEMGLQKYDIILAVNKKLVKKPEMVIEAVQNTKPGGNIRITFFSWNKIKSVTATGRLK